MLKVVDHDERRGQIAHAACMVVARYDCERATVVRTPQRFTECAFWTAFRGQVSADARARRLNAWVHREYARLFRRRIATRWRKMRLSA